jgi:hypothetical protein
MGNKKCGTSVRATEQIGGNLNKDDAPPPAEAATEVGADDEEQADLVFLWAVVAILTVTIIAIGVAILGGGND